ncbi:aspartate-semialdehyde dehydrogenase [Terriglobus roseus DSM 18391]|uniref:Aspartate-semialdehyde dehydrogenase n=1 Tax=Terriglobus roseus (strain DSM 18391 / NRRL B-41598 / KBS 63) TaxID=926566 RepID=I3ZK60_TERRK|nr:Asd/ArgC dimerization domain-containing protein [Terriglobus roseus]AFL89628.1 aspartate-semialdehyde dehydrogenase [Terriglobus roseus DSM 18391]
MKKIQYRIAVVGASSLLGKEIGDEIAESPLAAANTILLDTEEAGGTLEAIGDEAAFLQTLEPASLENLDVAIFADAKMLKEYGQTARALGASVVDVTGSDFDSTAPVRSPLVGDAAPLDLEANSVRVAHPVATMLALVLGLAGRAGDLRSAAATVLQPASENGRAALDELQQQSINLLSFQAVPTEEFDAQVAFNLLPTLGEAARNPLALSEERIRRDLRGLVSTLPQPLLQLIQAPVFHGFGVSLFLEFDQPLTPGALQAALSSEYIDIAGEEPPSNISSAGQGRVLLQVKPSPDNARYAIWMTADNLKLTARTAVACALELTRLKPLGTVQ